MIQAQIKKIPLTDISISDKMLIIEAITDYRGLLTITSSCEDNENRKNWLLIEKSLCGFLELKLRKNIALDCATKGSFELGKKNKRLTLEIHNAIIIVNALRYYHALTYDLEKAAIDRMVGQLHKQIN